MRIVIAKKLLSAVGGSEVQARALGRALAARGHEVEVVGMRPAWARPGIPSAAARGARGPVRERLDGIALTYVPARGGAVGAALEGLLPTSLVDERLLAEVVAGADVVHSIAREWAGPIEKAARRVGAAFVETPLVHPGQRWGGDGSADIARYRRADAVIALTEWEASWYREQGATRVHVTGVGPVLESVPDVPPDPATVLFVGRKERYKGYHALREAARLVWRSRPDARFVAIGQRAWHDLLSPADGDPRWDERGVVSEEEKADAYARATMFAMPSDHETFGHAYLEAWTAGCPVIAGDIPPLWEVVREGVDGFHVRKHPDDIAAAILRLLADPDLARRMGEAGRERVRERWTWETIALLTERAYGAAVGSGA